MSSPLNIDNVTMTGSFVTINLNKNWNSFILQMRTAVACTVRAPGTTDYYTIKSGQQLVVGSHNFIVGDQIQVNAANGTVLELCGNVRN